MEESIEETGWKLVHGDVFRPPNNNRLFASIIGSGGQIFCMMGITIFFAMLGMLSPASRGALLTAAIFLYEVCTYISDQLVIYFLPNYRIIYFTVYGIIGWLSCWKTLQDHERP